MSSWLPSSKRIGGDLGLVGGARLGVVVHRQGLEPRTVGLRGHCSAIELAVRSNRQGTKGCLMDACRSPDRSIVDVGGSNRASARLAAVLFAVAGLLALANAMSPQAAGHRTPTQLVGLADLVVAAAAWLLPWDGWPSWSTIALAPPAFAIIVFANAVAASISP